MNTNTNIIKNNLILTEYKDLLMDTLKYSFPLLYKEELSEGIDYSINKRLKNGKASLDNNYTRKTINGTVLDIINYIKSREPIVTSSGVLFKQHEESDNPLSRMISGFVKSRGVMKDTMFKYPKGSEMFERYNLFQILEKLNANACYGVLGNCTALFYNIYVAEAVTRQGRSYISCSIMLFESLLANNIKFNSLNEIITFINNIVKEKDERKLLDDVILDRNITLEEAFYKVLNTVDPMIWIPTEKEMSLVWEYMRGLSQEDLNRIYYKNNLYTFCELPIVNDLLVKILKELQVPFMNPNKPPKEIKDDLDTLTEMIKEYVYYKYPYIDKLDRIEYMKRDVVLIVDTDSNIISFDAWYNFLLSKVYNIDMPIKHEKFEMVDIVKADEFGDRPLRELCNIVEPRFDYDFYTDEVIEIERLVEPCKIIPQDSLKYSIINIMAYVCSNLIVDYLNQYCYRCGSSKVGTKSKMIMKNEFLFDRVLLTDNRRNYADVQILQEGNIVPEGSRMAIQGLPINKSVLSDDIKRKLQKVLYEQVLTSKNVDQIKIMKELVLIEKEIYKSIMNKETKYYKPDNVAAINTYKKDPLSINGIVACIIYNELRDPDMPAINLEERNKIMKLKIDVDKKSAMKIKDTYPEVYERLIKLLDHPTLGSKIKTIGFPVDSVIPDWILEFADFNSIVNDNLKNFPVESIGLRRLDNDNVNFSNIIKL